MHPIAAVQVEYSLFTRDVEGEVLGAARELGVQVVAYSPLGRGMLTGRYVCISLFFLLGALLTRFALCTDVGGRFRAGRRQTCVPPVSPLLPRSSRHKSKVTETGHYSFSENIPRILELVDAVRRIGAKYDATPGQVALAWLLAQGGDVIPIPGTKSLSVRHLRSIPSHPSIPPLLR